MNPRCRSSKRNDQGVVAIELVVIMPLIIALIVCIIALAGLFSTKSRVVGAARDGARALSLKPGAVSPIADPNTSDGITVTLDSAKCPALSDQKYQLPLNDPDYPKVKAKATTTYTVSIPFVHTWSNVAVTERAIMPCG